MQQFYYSATIRNIVIAFTDMFNNLSVKKYTDMSLSAVAKVVPVPILFAPVEKFHQLRKEEESLVRFYQSIPRMAITLDGIEYSAERATGVNEQRYFIDPISGTSVVVTDVQPTPYDLLLSLKIKTDSMNDYCQILENILPYFNPSLDLRVKEFSFLNLERDLKVVLEAVTPEFLEDIGETETRSVNATLSFRIHAQMYRPVEASKVITKIDTKYIISQAIDVAAISATYYEQFSLSGFNALSAAPASSQFQTSGATENDVLWYRNVQFYNM